jgi:hypothetical protein
MHSSSTRVPPGPKISANPHISDSPEFDSFLARGVHRLNNEDVLLWDERTEVW